LLNRLRFYPSHDPSEQKYNISASNVIFVSKGNFRKLLKFLNFDNSTITDLARVHDKSVMSDH